jgi:hypothetical protein
MATRLSLVNYFEKTARERHGRFLQRFQGPLPPKPHAPPAGNPLQPEVTYSKDFGAIPRIFHLGRIR